MTNYSTNFNQRQSKLIIAHRDLAKIPRSSIRSEAISYHVQGIGPKDQIDRVIFCLSAYYWHGDEHRSVPAYQHDDDARIKAIMDVFYRSQKTLKLSDDQLTKVFIKIVKACSSRKAANAYSFEQKRMTGETPDQFLKRKQQRGNIRNYQEAFDRIIRTYQEMTQKIGKAPSLNALCKQARCAATTARKALQTLGEVTSNSRLSLVPKAVVHLSERVGITAKHLQDNGLQDLKSPSLLINFISSIPKDLKYKILENKYSLKLLKMQSDLKNWKALCAKALAVIPISVLKKTEWVSDGVIHPDETEWTWMQVQMAPKLPTQMSLTDLQREINGCGNGT